jgi:hypothetical protein
MSLNIHVDLGVENQCGQSIADLAHFFTSPCAPLALPVHVLPKQEGFIHIFVRNFRSKYRSTSVALTGLQLFFDFFVLGCFSTYGT